MLFSRKQGEWLGPLSICKSDCFGSCSGKDFMLEAVDVLKGVRLLGTLFERLLTFRLLIRFWDSTNAPPRVHLHRR
jgi:hypothetical protein